MGAIYKRIKFIFCTVSICLSIQLSAQYSWTQKANFPGAIRTYAAGFSIGQYGFVGCGASSPGGPSFYNDFYKWNQTTNTWSAIANYPGAGYHLSPVSFAIEGKGYVGLGWTGSAGATDLWSYDTTTNTWTAMATFPGTGRYDEAVFVIGHKAYIISGSTGGPPYIGDVWMYDAHANSWTQKSNSPAGDVDAGVAFAIGNHGYYGGGKDGSSSYNTFWEYDTTSDTWTSIAAFPTAGTPSGNSRAFVIGSKGYVCTGTKSNSYTNDMSDGYAYDTNTHAWVYFTNMGVNGIERAYSVAFTIGNCGYIATGEDSLGNMHNDLQQWGPDSTAPANCNVWTQKTNFPGAIRTYAAGFSIGQYGFVGCGASSPGGPSFYNDFYKWNQTTNTWSAIANYPGAGYHLSPVSFAIEGKGYVGLGWTGSAGATDLWSYDTTTNTWTAMATFPGTGRYDEAVFVIGHKAYIISGSTGGPPYIGDVWMYDAHANSWTQKSNSPAGDVDAGVAFAIGNHGYYGGGKDGSSSYNTFWEYDTTSDTWTSIAAFPTAGTPSGNSRAFVIGSKGYVCTGTKSNSYTNDMSDGYAYDTNTHAWVYFTNMGVNGIERAYSVAFTINHCGYISTGEDSIGGMHNDLWGYCPCTDTALSIASISKQSIQMNIYPNPSSGILHINYNVVNGQGVELRIMDIFGRCLNTYRLNGQDQEMTINETALSNGMYFYQVIDSGNLISSGKFIISK